MSYHRVPDEIDETKLKDFWEDLLKRKEFYSLKWAERNFRDPNDYDALRGKFLKIQSHQLFVKNFMNPETPYKRLLLKHTMGMGKCFAKDTPILMHDGTIRVVQDIKPGDVLMGDDSTPRHVLNTSQGTEEMFRVKMSNGESFVCNRSHILCLVYPKKFHSDYQNITIDEYLCKTPEWRALYKLYKKPTEFAHGDVFPGGYLAGYLLASGRISSHGIRLEISSEDSLNYIWDNVCERDLILKHISYNEYCIELREDFAGIHKSVVLMNQLKSIITGPPREYLVNSRQIRLDVLAGIIDACGEVIRDGYMLFDFPGNHKESLRFLVESLGFLYKEDGGAPLILAGKQAQIPLMNPNKMSSKNYYDQLSLSFSFTLESLGEGNYYGFSIDGNRKFFLGNFLVAHNTLSALVIAQSFIDIYRKAFQNVITQLGPSRKTYAEAEASTPNVFIIGFTKGNIIREILKYPELGYITIQEREELNVIQRKASMGDPNEIKRYKEVFGMLKKRITSKPKGGFFRFYGYQEFVNRLFLSDELNLVDIEAKVMQNPAEGESLEDIIYRLINEKKIRINTELLKQFENSLLICDEVHNIYNSFMKNNYGVAIQYVLNVSKNLRALFLSATPINNSPSEIIDVMNLLLPPNMKLHKKDFFDKTGALKEGKLRELGYLSFGRVSFLQDINPKYFPEKIMEGEPRVLRHPINIAQIRGKSDDLKGIMAELPYLTFDICPMSKLHLKTYKEFLKESDQLNTGEVPPVISTTGYAIYDLVFPNPDNDEVGLFNSNDVRVKISSSSETWRSKVGVQLNKLATGSLLIGGDWLFKENVGKYSTKCFKLLETIDDNFAKALKAIKENPGEPPYLQGEKIMIYHNRVKTSGVLLYQELLKQNGFVDEYSEPVDNTRCSICGGYMGKHAEFIKKEKIPDHNFYPCRFLIAHSEIDKVTMDRALIKYNAIENAFGHNYKVLIGSKIIREGYDMKDVRLFCIMSSPINISSLLQVFGRAIRKNSHINLPPSKRNVHLHLYLTTIPEDVSDIDTVSPEEYKYAEKLYDYQIIQRIEKEINKYSIDGPIHRNIVMPPALLKEYFPGIHPEDIKGRELYQEDLVPKYGEPNAVIGSLYFDLPLSLPEYNLGDLSLSTFLAYGKDIEETHLISYIIKRLFILNPVWHYDDLWETTKRPPFGVEYNPALFSEDNFIIALDNLVLINQTFIDQTKDAKESPEVSEKIFASMLFDFNERYIYREGVKHKIEQIGEYYILFPVITKESDKKDIIVRDIESFIRPMKYVKDITINLDKWVAESKAEYNYSVKKNNFIRKYIDVKTTHDMLNFLGDYEATFYDQLLRDIIVWYIDKRPVINKDLEDLYSRVIDLLDKFNSIIYISDVLLYKETAKKLSGGKVITFDNKGKPQSKFPKGTPVGFLEQDSVMLYDSPAWVRTSKTALNIQTQFTENNKLIGYFDAGFDGQIKFKIRKPIQIIRKEASEKDSGKASDVRVLEKGIVCATKTKPELLNLLDKLGIKEKDLIEEKDQKKRKENISNKKQLKIGAICNLIKYKLLELEMEERMKDSKIKYFYLWHEVRPQLNLARFGEVI